MPPSPPDQAPIALAPTPRWSRRDWLFATGVIALAIMLGWLGRPQEIGVDEATHLSLAKSLLSGHYRDEFLVNRPVHTKYPPIMSIWLLVVQFVAGSSLDAVRAANLLLHAASALLIGDSVRRLGWPVLGLGTTAVIVLNPSLLALAGTLRSETLYVMLTSVALWSSLHPQATRARHSVLTAAAAGGAFLTRSAGITLIGAVAIIGAYRHRKARVGLGLSMIAIASAWLLYAVLRRDGGGGSYAIDLSLIHGTPTGILRNVGGASVEYAKRTQFVQFGLPNLPTKLDTLVGAITIPALTIIGMVRLAKKWPLAALNLVLGTGLLLLWPWVHGRFLAPLMPSIIAMMLVGMATAGARFLGAGAERAALGVAIILGLSGAATAGRAAATGVSCRSDPASLMNPRCTRTESRVIAPASRFARDSLPRGAVIAASKNALVNYISGHPTVPVSAQAPDGQLAFLAPGSGVDYLMLATLDAGVPRGVVVELASACDRLGIVREFPLRTILITRRVDGTSGSSACTRLTSLVASWGDSNL